MWGVVPLCVISLPKLCLACQDSQLIKVGSHLPSCCFLIIVLLRYIICIQYICLPNVYRSVSFFYIHRWLITVLTTMSLGQIITSEIEITYPFVVIHCSLQPWVTFICFFVSIDLLVLGIFCKKDDRLFGSLGLAAFIWHVFKVHQCFSLCQRLIFPFLIHNPLCGYATLS